MVRMGTVHIHDTLRLSEHANSGIQRGPAHFVSVQSLH